MPKIFGEEFLDTETKNRGLGILRDIFIFLLILLGLGVFWLALRLLQYVGFDPKEITWLEKLDFYGAAGTMTLMVIDFMGNIIVVNLLPKVMLIIERFSDE